MSSLHYGYGPTVSLCSILDHMRSCHKTRDYSRLPALIEDAQFVGDRMEDALSSVESLKKLTEARSKLKKQVKKLEKKLEALSSENNNDS